MTYTCYHHKIIPENYFALTVAGQLLYNGRCVEVPRLPHIELVECTPQSSTRWELKKLGPVWGSLRLHQDTAGGERKEWCISQVCVLLARCTGISFLVLFFCFTLFYSSRATFLT